jgi:adenine-specific DNA-methyltransferase
MNDEKIMELQSIIRKLFQFDNSDLDFGIYRIINIKRKEISEFIDKELFDIINKKIKKLGDNSELKSAVDSLRVDIEESFGCNIEEAKTKYAETPKVKSYIDKEKELKATEKEAEIEGEIYDDIINFFSRYYDKGDFISKRRYSKDNKYAIPYNGEEVYLYWANNDQYYIKTGENFKNYSFKADSLKVKFELVSEEVEVEKGNIKDPEKKSFIFHDANYDADKKLVSVLFGYRGLADEETNAITALTEKKNVGKDEVNTYNLKKINEKIALFGLSDLQKKHIKMDGEKSDKSELEWHLNKYTTKNTTDYFIHKNLKRFLSQELDFYIKNEILHIDDIQSKEIFNSTVNKIKTFKEISLKIIEFLSQVEDFQKMLWEKRKFVISTDYCMTLDYVAEKYYPKILENKAQLEEWMKLYSFDIEKEAKLLKGKLTAQGKSETEKKIEVLKQNPTLVIDTKFYEEDFKYQLISEIDDLDEKTNGILIKSENFQALNLLMNKCRERIQCCYIDPPYNTGGDGFLYKDGFNHSSWLSMMENRLSLFYYLLNEKGVIFSSIDDNENINIRKLFDLIFNENNFVSDLIWRKKTGASDAKGIATITEYVPTYIKNIEYLEQSFTKNKNSYDPNRYALSDEHEKRRGKHYVDNLDRGGIRYSDSLNYPIKCPDGSITYPNGRTEFINDGWIWTWGKDKLEWGIKNGFIVFKKSESVSSGWRVYYKNYVNVNNKDEFIERSAPHKNLILDIINTEGTLEINNLFNYKIYKYPKPSRFIKEIISYVCQSKVVLDFFAGSGTTGHAVLKLNKEDEGNRKFILVEMAEYFDTVLKPRILKVIYSDNWKEGKPLDNNGSKKQIIKYQVLEQYEDSLNNINFAKPNVIAKESKDYKIKYMLEFESKGSNVFLNLDALDNPFEYKLKFEENNELKEKNIDLVETFNYLAGITVKSIKKVANGPITYVIVKGYRNEKDVIVIWRNKPEGFDPVKDKEFIEKEILKEEYDEILVNGNSLVKGAKSIDEIFKTSMFGGI